MVLCNCCNKNFCIFWIFFWLKIIKKLRKIFYCLLGREINKIPLLVWYSNIKNCFSLLLLLLRLLWFLLRNFAFVCFFDSFIKFFILFCCCLLAGFAHLLYIHISSSCFVGCYLLSTHFFHTHNTNLFVNYFSIFFSKFFLVILLLLVCMYVLKICCIFFTKNFFFAFFNSCLIFLSFWFYF